MEESMEGNTEDRIEANMGVNTEGSMEESMVRAMAQNTAQMAGTAPRHRMAPMVRIVLHGLVQKVPMVQEVRMARSMVQKDSMDHMTQTVQKVPMVQGARMDQSTARLMVRNMARMVSTVLTAQKAHMVQTALTVPMIQPIRRKYHITNYSSRREDQERDESLEESEKGELYDLIAYLGTWVLARWQAGNVRE